jgi:glyoxylase-like metal-dependent hydrolase (beta-lactamase superfamily II)
MMKMKTFINGPIETNTYLVWDEAALEAMIVDPGAENPLIADEIAKLGLDPVYIVLTHGHHDHTEGIPYFRGLYPGIKLVASRAERRLLMERHGSSQGGISADIEVRDGDEMKLGESLMRFVMTPGHTPGGMCVYFPEEQVLFSGDTLFFASVGRTDLWGGSDEELIASLKKLMELFPDCVKVYPGHMKETTIGFERRYNPFV